ncbi:MAG: phosphatase PAP2/dual specificity phosphatase family protein [Planctomycetes bacterium]|nr:phosphatase PAP2/dual specificity phosphatase family protein [Planctomycetota bacterium]
MKAGEVELAGAIHWKQSVLWLLLLGPLFFLSYGWANQWAADRGVTRSIVFGWEAHIPFLPWTIVPYWSIDLMYGLSFLYCRSAREVHRHGLRLLTAQGIAVACFVAFPLRYSGARPETDGLLGSLFKALEQFDLPYNQAPSLHIALLVIIWWVLVRRASRPWRWVWHGWAALVAVSVLTTRQHHFFDVPTGAFLGLLCLWLWPDEGGSPLRRSESPLRPRLAILYGSAALILACLAMCGGLALWLAWPAVALGMVALFYGWIGVAGFQKFGGRQSLAVRWLLAPYRLGAWVNSRLWTRRHRQPDQVAERVWLGRIPTKGELAAGGFDAVVDLTAEFDTPWVSGQRQSIPMLDLAVPSLTSMRAAVHALEEAESSCQRVLVCCALGYSRSALAVAGWLLASGRCGSVQEAMAQVTAARPHVVFTEDHRALLEALDGRG